MTGLESGRTAGEDCDADKDDTNWNADVDVNPTRALARVIRDGTGFDRGSDNDVDDDWGSIKWMACARVVPKWLGGVKNGCALGRFEIAVVEATLGFDDTMGTF